MSVEIRASGETVTACCQVSLTTIPHGQYREAIDNAVELNMPSRLVLNFKNISFMDSSGIGLVMGRYRTLSKTGAELVISETPPQIYKVMKLAGLERLARLESR